MSQPSLAEFREEATAFLDANASLKAEEKRFVWGQGPDSASLFREPDRDKEAEDLARAKAWRAKRWDAGLGWISGPSRYGGRELPGPYDRAYSELEARYDVPNQSYFGIGLGMVAPTIKDHARPEVAGEVLPAMYRADIVGCQLFSEPGAGSDLAGLQTRAVRDGEEWLISGQKVWTSGAHYSDIGEVLTRTDPTLPKHKGLTAFIVDMKAPGRRGAPAAPDDRRVQLQRGVLQRGPGAGREPPG